MEKDLPYAKYWFQRSYAKGYPSAKYGLQGLSNIKASATPTVQQVSLGDGQYYDLAFDRYAPYVSRTSIGNSVSQGNNHSFVVRFNCSASDRIIITILNRNDRQGQTNVVESFGSLGIGHAANGQVIYDKMFDIPFDGHNKNSTLKEQMSRLKNKLSSYGWKLKK